eukprot:CAMPEP_0184663584 /NCGR_PEP_ID=MMETSP0308-20130426/48776_1 /TAXON_ID=38269 /ORGANISM="Gloeochaete witrockiana, Strain SAG 46.84" /LENGTH=89 /DNA_ID=CAMNT_0027106409 /DNA_START=12 /DNA_END=277 /DNA_ORIENTATION=+
MACRSQSGETAAEDINSRGIPGHARFAKLDLMSLKSVRQFSAGLVEEGQPIDVLINNAGIMIPPYALSEDGFESQFQTNYLGHFLLTDL